jgi:hypothetical protein
MPALAAGAGRTGCAGTGMTVAVSHPGWGVRMAVRVAFLIGSALAVAVVVALLSSHRAEAATPAAQGSLAGSPGPVTGLPGTTKVPPRHPLATALTQIAPATAPVRQTLRPVVEQIAPATAPVRHTLRPVVGQIAPATAPVRQTLRPIVQQVPPATTASRGHAAPPAFQPEGLTPAGRSGMGPGLIEVPSATARTAGDLGSAARTQSVVAPGASVLSTGSGSPTLDGRGTKTLGSSLDAPGPAASPGGPGLPASPWQSGGGAVPAPTGSGGGGHLSGGLSSLLASRALVLGLVVAIVGLIALWSAGRPAPRPEVSPA